MKVVAAYMLAVLGGNANPSADDVKKILGSVGAEATDSNIEFLLSQLNGKDITELVASGREKLASVSSVGSAAVAAPAATAAAAPAEDRKEEKVEEEEEEEEEDYIPNIFGDEDDYWSLHMAVTIDLSRH